MFNELKFIVGIATDFVRQMSSSARRHVAVQQLSDCFNEFLRRTRRAGLIFTILVSALLLFNLVLQPVGLLLWLIAIPLAGFTSLLSFLWPTRRSPRKGSTPDVAYVARIALSALNRSREEIPPCASAAFDLVTRRVKSIGILAIDRQDSLVIDEARRLIGQHLPRLVESFVALPHGDRTEARTDSLSDGLGAIAEELVDLEDRLRASRKDRFEVEHRFIASRFPRRGLAGL